MISLVEFRRIFPLQPADRALVAAVVTVIFAGVARLLRGVTTSGAWAGAVVCFLLYANAGFGAFAGLVTVFILAWITTRFGYRRKQYFGVAEERAGRKASQVLANLAMAAICACLYGFDRRPGWLLACAAALAEASADTVSSEIGQAIGEQARLITTWEPVLPGTNGGVTLLGTLAGVSSAAIVTLVLAATAMIPWKWFAISVAGATAGMLGDSVLGAWLERRGILNNNSVNFLGTSIASALALVFIQCRNC
jgi:uncharacterized protein (TIGR00297 family)